jgi:hypothetical protein
VREFADRERRAAGKIDQQQRRRRDARLVDRCNQRNVDQRRAEAGKSAHEAGQRRDCHGGDEATVRQRGREGRHVRKFGHVKVPAGRI